MRFHRLTLLFLYLVAFWWGVTSLFSSLKYSLQCWVWVSFVFIHHKYFTIKHLLVVESALAHSLCCSYS